MKSHWLFLLGKHPVCLILLTLHDEVIINHRTWETAEQILRRRCAAAPLAQDDIKGESFLCLIVVPYGNKIM